MEPYPDQSDLYHILTRDLKLDAGKASVFISAIKHKNLQVYIMLEQEIKIQAQDSKKDTYDLHNKMLMYNLFQFYITVGFIILFLYFIK